MLSGTKRIQYLEENAAAFHLKLSLAEQEALESIFHPDQVFFAAFNQTVGLQTTWRSAQTLLNQYCAAMPGGGWQI